MKKYIFTITLILHTILANAGIKIDTILLYKGGPKYVLNSGYTDDNNTCDLVYMNSIAAMRNFGGAMDGKYGRTEAIIGDFFEANNTFRYVYPWVIDTGIEIVNTTSSNINEILSTKISTGNIFIKSQKKEFVIRGTIKTKTLSNGFTVLKNHDDVALFGIMQMECIYYGLKVDTIAKQYFVNVEDSPKSKVKAVTVCINQEKYNLNELIDKLGGKFYISLRGSKIRKEIPNGELNVPKEGVGTYDITYIKPYKNDINESQSVIIALDIIAPKPILSLQNWNLVYCDSNLTLKLSDIFSPSITSGKYTYNGVELQSFNISKKTGINLIVYSASDENNCLSIRAATIFVIPKPSKPILTGAKSCGESSLTLFAKGSKNVNEKYEWRNWQTKTLVSNDSIYKTELLKEKTTYIVQLSDVKTGCKSEQDTVSAYINYPVPLFSGPNISICKTSISYNLNNDVNIKGGVFTTIPNGLIKSDSILDITKAVEGIITVVYTFRTSQNCVSTHTRNLTITALPILTISRDTTVCQYANFDLKASLNGTDWTGDNVNKSGNVYAIKTGTFIILNSYKTGGCNVSKTLKLIVNPAPLSPTIEGERTKCIHDTLLSYAFPNSEKIIKIRWYTDTTKAFVATGLKYGLIGKPLSKVFADNINEFGCISGKSEKAINVINVTGTIKSTVNEILQGDYVNFTSNLTTNQTITSYDWNFGDSSAHATLKNVVHYYIDSAYKNPIVKLKVTTTDNCSFLFPLSNTLLINPYKPNIRTDAMGQKQQNYSGYTLDNLITYYPNPVQNVLKMSAYNELSFVNVQILNPYGYEIHNSQYLSVNELEFDLTGQPSGLYMLIIKDAKGAITHHKIIKQ